MPNWDENSPELNGNIVAAFDMARRSAADFEAPNLELPRKWHTRIMQGLTPTAGAHPSWYGKFRGEAGQEFIGVTIGPYEGTPPDLVAKELADFIGRTQKFVAWFDQEILAIDKKGNTTLKVLDDSALRAIIGLMAFVHGEWIRIHPFANGNGRTARLWANWIAMRYGLPPFVSLRPRPGRSYEQAAYKSMEGDWQAMRPVFEAMVDDWASEIAEKD